MARLGRRHRPQVGLIGRGCSRDARAYWHTSTSWQRLACVVSLHVHGSVTLFEGFEARRLASADNCLASGGGGLKP